MQLKWAAAKVEAQLAELEERTGQKASDGAGAGDGSAAPPPPMEDEEKELAPPPPPPTLYGDPREIIAQATDEEKAAYFTQLAADVVAASAARNAELGKAFLADFEVAPLASPSLLSPRRPAFPSSRWGRSPL